LCDRYRQGVEPMQHFRRPKAETLVMFLVVSGFAFFALGQSCGGGGGTPGFSITSVVLSGPATLPNDGPNGVYTAVITVTRTGGLTGPINTGTSPWWLVDADSGLPGFGEGPDNLSFVPGGVVIPAGSSTATVTWSLGCRNRTVQGTALTGPGGSPNNPDSGEGNSNMLGPDSGAADIVVVYPGAPNSNTVSVNCMCGGSVCP
jgi:hypothetical protein